MTIDEVVQMLNACLPKPLTPLQEWLLRQAWEGKTYTNMAVEANYVEEYLRRTAAGLWSSLSNLWGEPISKNHFRAILAERSLTAAQQKLIEVSKRTSISTPPDFPSGPLPLDAKFYIPRSPIEELAYEEITKPGSVTRIKAGRRMGKSSLMLRIMARAAALNYRTVTIDFQQTDKAIFANLDKFLRWFCANISWALQIEPKLDDYWDKDIGSKLSCTIYFQAYLLERIQTPLVLALNEMNLLFEYPTIAQDFFPLLRSWYEQGKTTDIWQNLRLVVSYSREIYFPLQLNQSPFNIGLPLKLPFFNKDQVQELAQRYGLDWIDRSKVRRLMSMMGGYPFLLQLAFYYLSKREFTFKQLLEQAATTRGIYHDYLRQLVVILQEDINLKNKFKQVLLENDSLRLEPKVFDKLDSLGLISMDGDRVIPSCKLYRQYFGKQLYELENESHLFQEETDATIWEQLETEKQQLQQLLNQDELTGVANRRYFNSYLRTEWEKAGRDRQPLALIFCEVDYFKIYNEIYGESIADDCLRQVASTINEVVHNWIDETYTSLVTAVGENLQPSDPRVCKALVARYRGNEFAVILTETQAYKAVQVAETIRKEIQSLGISTVNFRSKFDGFPANVVTASLGVAGTIADTQKSSDILVQAAAQALYKSKKNCRNCVTFLPIQDESI